MSNELTQADDQATQANELVKKYAIAAAALGAVPLPLVDLALIFGIQFKMIHRLCGTYEVPFSKELGRSAIASLVSGSGAAVLGWGVNRLAASLVKSVPFVGTIAGAAATASFSYAATYAVGKVFTQHFETGGTLLSFEANRIRGYYEGQLGSAKKASSGQSFVGVKP
ncbi:MAG: DUF697 domain-containing protein [Gammaproteobacteria bacterium]|nr:DUF697 domain-containing protein [Gammaproteobacteria bacterium]